MAHEDFHVTLPSFIRKNKRVGLRCVALHGEACAYYVQSPYLISQCQIKKEERQAEEGGDLYHGWGGIYLAQFKYMSYMFVLFWILFCLFVFEMVFSPAYLPAPLS